MMLDNWTLFAGIIACLVVGIDCVIDNSAKGWDSRWHWRFLFWVLIAFGWAVNAWTFWSAMK